MESESVDSLAPAITVKVIPFVAVPPTVTATFPVVAPGGTGTLMYVSFQCVGVAAVPLNVTVLFPWMGPKPVPWICTMLPTTPTFGETVLMAGVTAKPTALLTCPPTVTTTFPVLAE
jgi:hypothetical protein